jgi:putative protease
VGLSEEKLQEVGKITHFFSKISVAVVELTAPLSVGEKIRVQGPTTDFEQTVQSMQIEHANVTTATKGQSVGLKVNERVRENDTVYKVV